MFTLSDTVDKIARLADPNPSVEVKRIIEDLVLKYRSLFIRRDHDKGRAFHDTLIQTMVNVPVGLSEYNPGSSKFTALKTEKIPSTIRLVNKPGFTFVGTNNRQIEYKFVHPNALKIVTNSRYSYKNFLYTLMDKEIYLFQEKHSTHSEDTNVNYPKHIRIEGLFEDPRELFDYYGKDGNRAYDLDQQFPLTQDLEKQIIDSILSTEFRVMNPERRNEVRTDPQ